MNFSKKYPYADRSRQTIENWFYGYIGAENQFQPNRYKLINVYDYAFLDLHLSAIWQNRKNKILGNHFDLLNPLGEVDEEAKKLFEGIWYNQFVDYALDSVAFGYSLIEFGEFVDGVGLSEVNLIDRRLVNVDRKEFLSSPYNNFGTPFTEGILNDYCLWVDTKTLGFMLKASPVAIYKRFGFGGFTEHVEKHNLPLLTVKSGLKKDDPRYAEIENAILNAGRNRTLILGEDEEANALDMKGDGDIYVKHIDTCNSEMSKLVQGQVGTSEIGSNYREASSHENVSNEYAQNDLSFVTAIVNTLLIPKLAKLGAPIQGYKIRYNSDKKEPLQDRIRLFSLLLDKYDIDTETIYKEFGVTVLPKPSPTIDANA
jgi:hypothetical protein